MCSPPSPSGEAPQGGAMFLKSDVLKGCSPWSLLVGRARSRRSTSRGWLARAAQHLAPHPHVRVLQLDVMRDPITAQHDLVFAMGVLEFVHGPDLLQRVTTKLSAALRLGGLLVVNDVRLPLEIEDTWWARGLAEGGTNQASFMDGRGGLRLVDEHIHPAYVIALFEKPPGEKDCGTRLETVHSA